MAAPVKSSELITKNDRIYHLGLRPEQLARNLFVVGDPARADRVAEHFDTIEHRVENREFVTRTGTWREMPITVIATGIGTDNNEVALVEAFALNEYDLRTRIRKTEAQPLTIIRIGTSGGLQKDITVGTLAISSYGLGLDNTGLYYELDAACEACQQIEEKAYRLVTAASPAGRRFKGKIHPYASKASPEVVDALVRNAGANYVIGITASAPGFYAPQGRALPGLKLTVPGLQEQLATLRVDGLRVVNLEMESSLLFHLARQLGYQSGTICAIIANRMTGAFLEDYSSAVESAIDAGLKAMHELHSNTPS
ncbi:MAG: nucleoside phosphorylase [Promethearchaeota archaeon]